MGERSVVRREPVAGDCYTKEDRAKLQALLVEPVDFLALEAFVIELLDEVESWRYAQSCAEDD